MSLKNKLAQWLTSLSLATSISLPSVSPSNAAPASDIQGNLAEEKGKKMRYAIITSTNTYTGNWMHPVDALKTKYPQAQVFTFRTDMQEALPALRSYQPTHVAYVARPEELVIPELSHNPFTDIKTAAAAGAGKFTTLLCRLDDDSFPDAIGGIITGATADDALKLAAAKPFTISHALAKTLNEDENLVAFPNATMFSDGRPENGKVVKREKRGKNIKKTLLDVAGPEFLEILNTQLIDAVIVSCHASYRDWQMGWGYTDDRWIIGKNAAIYALAPDNTVSGTLNSTSSKFYLGAGNCESARIVQGKGGFESMALSWIHSGGVVQHLGYTLDTWHGFVGWNFRHAFLASDHPTVAEAYTQTLIATEHERQRLEAHRKKNTLPFITQNMQRFAENHELGKVYDFSGTTFYGDPWLDVRVGAENITPLFEKSLSIQKKESTTLYTCRLKSIRENTQINAPVVYRLPLSTKLLHVSSASPGLEYTLIDDCVIFETNEIYTNSELNIANHKPKTLPRDLEWKLELRLR